MSNEEIIWQLVDDKKDEFINFSDRVFDSPEILYKEFKSVSEHTKMLEKEGFKITKGICNMPTAVMGEYGKSGPAIAILGEFDALPGLSQQAGVAEHKPIKNGENGHGCGHNLLGAASLLAATAVKDWLKKIILKLGLDIMVVLQKKEGLQKRICLEMVGLIILIPLYVGIQLLLILLINQYLWLILELTLRLQVKRLMPPLLLI